MGPSQRAQCLLERSAHELEALRRRPSSSSLSSSYSRITPQLQHACFPAACRELLWSLPGNSSCVDCGQPNPEWASVSYGTLLCIACSGRHRSFGVQTSVVRSIYLDAWTHGQVLNMLEGGNDQLRVFFERHQMHAGTAKSRRYHTKAASFYRTHLAAHVERVAAMGHYPGRVASRQPQQQPQRQHSPTRGHADARAVNGSGSALVCVATSNNAAATSMTTAATATTATTTSTPSAPAAPLAASSSPSNPQHQFCRRESQRRIKRAGAAQPVQQTINAV